MNAKTPQLLTDKRLHQFFRDIKATISQMQRNLPKIDSGSATITPVANTPTSIGVTFARPFDNIPNVVATPDTGVVDQVQSWGVSNRTTSGFTMWVIRTNTTNVRMEWIAVDSSS